MAEHDAETMARVRARLTALIHPNVVGTEDERQAFERAAAYQADWEAEYGDAIDAARRGVQRFSVGDYSETYFSPAGSAGGMSAGSAAGSAGGISAGGGICPDARAALFNAGLLKRSLPCARRV